ncbi:G patch domain-containing protein 1 [Suncus etruscus]|uniref:G patch domain-containing protein 1 n=1 Tax=Suncus etruscus TaxID=109475 RepID=UPI00211026EA|nr:G patch domain-containing protein 1 [Suncus etruscus]
MAALDSDSEEDLVSYGKNLEPLEEGERPKKPVPLQDQTVRDEKGRYKRFHGAFSGGFSAGYFNTVGSKEGWTPSTFVSSRQNRADRSVLGPEDFMDEEDLSEFGIAPKAIVTTDDFASKTKDRIQEKARQLAAAAAPIPGATLLDDFVTPAKLSIGFELLRKMGWKEGQGIGPRVKRRPRRQKPDSGVKIYGCALPPGGSEGSEDEDDDYLPENVTFAPKDVMPVDFTPKDNVHGLAYRGLDPRQALFGTSGEHFNLFGGGPEEPGNLLEDIRVNKGRKLGISGQAFGVGALEEEDDDIYATETLSKYDTVLRDEEPGDGLYGWTAPKQYKGHKDAEKDLRYVGKILDGFSLASKPLSSKKTYPPPDLPKDYRPVHYFRPVVAATPENSRLCQVLSESAGKVAQGQGMPSRHQLNASKRGAMLGETSIQGSSTSVLEFLTQKDKERIQEMKQASDLKTAQVKAQRLAQHAAHSRLQSPPADPALSSWRTAWNSGCTSTKTASSFKPFAKDPEKQKRYEEFLANVKRGQKDALERCLDPSMTEWERGREQDEFARAALLYESSSSTLSSRFTHAKEEDDTDKVEVPRDQENDVGDKQSAVKMKMFGKLTRDTFEWHPDKLLCRRFNVPDPYPDSTIVGLPRVKRDKYSVFNFLTLPDPASLPTTPASSERGTQNKGPDKSRKPSRWDTSKQEKKEDSISEFLSLARSKVDSPKPEPSPLTKKEEEPVVESSSDQVADKGVNAQAEGEVSRPPMDLFKAIFASSSDEKSSSSEDEAGDSEDDEATGEADLKSSQEPNLEIPSVAPASQPAPQEPVPTPTFPIHKLQLDEREEFGPRLPPVFCPNARLEPEPPPKEKHKKNKEKHKAKKEHRRKKEKKKKHRKHKHKGKQKNKKSEKSSSSESTTSSDSQSDEEGVAGLSPQELLRR